MFLRDIPPAKKETTLGDGRGDPSPTGKKVSDFTITIKRRKNESHK